MYFKRIAWVASLSFKQEKHVFLSLAFSELQNLIFIYLRAESFAELLNFELFTKKFIISY